MGGWRCCVCNCGLLDCGIAELRLFGIATSTYRSNYRLHHITLNVMIRVHLGIPGHLRHQLDCDITCVVIRHCGTIPTVPHIRLTTSLPLCTEVLTLTTLRVVRYYFVRRSHSLTPSHTRTTLRVVLVLLVCSFLIC